MFVPDISPFNFEPQKERPRTQEDGLIKEFFTKPYALPVWLWNCLVIYIMISLAWFLIKIGVIILAGLAFFLLGIFG